MTTLTPADDGTIAATLDDAKAMGLGDDDTVDLVHAALIAECGFDEWTAAGIAYRVVHG